MTHLGRTAPRRERRRHHDPKRRPLGAVPRRARLRRGAHVSRERQCPIRDGRRHRRPRDAQARRSRRRCARASATTRGSSWSPSPSSSARSTEFPFDESDAARQPWVVFCVDTATRDELAEAAASVDRSGRSCREGPRRRVLEPAERLVDRHPVREDPREGGLQVAHDQSQSPDAREDRGVRDLSRVLARRCLAGVSGAAFAAPDLHD